MHEKNHSSNDIKKLLKGTLCPSDLGIQKSFCLNKDYIHLELKQQEKKIHLELLK